MRIYLGGPMAGVPNLNFPAFKAARERLRAGGHTVFCPAEHSLATETVIDNDSQTFRRRVLAIDLVWICQHAEAVALLPGWERSTGATAERATAVALGLAIMELDDA